MSKRAPSQSGQEPRALKHGDRPQATNGQPDDADQFEDEFEDEFESEDEIIEVGGDDDDDDDAGVRLPTQNDGDELGGT